MSRVQLGRLRPVVIGVGMLVCLGLLTRVLSRRSFVSPDEYSFAKAHRLPHGIDTLVSLQTAQMAIRDCNKRASGDWDTVVKSRRGTGAPGSGGCNVVVYVWSPLMPLSRVGIPNVIKASSRLAARLILVGASDVVPGNLTSQDRLGAHSADDPSLDTMLGAGVTVHYPSILVYREGRLEGSAILGYKSAEAYHDLIQERLRNIQPAATGRAAGSSPATIHVIEPTPATNDGGHSASTWRDVAVPGKPGAYFRYMRTQNAIVFSSGDDVKVLALDKGAVRSAPGYIDLVPSPDGRFVVSQGRNGSGLEFFEAAELFISGAKEADSSSPQPFFIDREMIDYYPSVGLVGNQGSRVFVYRVLTSWGTRVAFRDYEFTFGSADMPPVVRPIGRPKRACNNGMSIAIMSSHGLELAARDERTGTTKLFHLRDTGQCDELLNLGMQTGKVAWSHDARRLAFAIPFGAVRDGTGVLWENNGVNRELAGVFVLDRDDMSLSRLGGSGHVNRLTFPEFVGDDTVAFLLAGGSTDGKSFFRLVCCSRKPHTQPTR